MSRSFLIILLFLHQKQNRKVRDLYFVIASDENKNILMCSNDLSSVFELKIGSQGCCCNGINFYNVIVKRAASIVESFDRVRIEPSIYPLLSLMSLIITAQ